MTPSTNKREKVIKTLAAALFWAAVWQLCALLAGSELILPSPLQTVRAFFGLACTGAFWLTATVSLFRVLAGTLAGIALGAVLGAVTGAFSLCDALFTPALRIMRSTPVVSFIIILILWLGKSAVPGFIAAIMVAPVVAGPVKTAIDTAPCDLLEMAQVYKMPTGKKLKLIYIPWVKAPFVSACLTAGGLGWKSGVAAEVLCQPALSIGTELHNSKVYLETPELFAWTAVVILLSWGMERALLALSKRRGDK